MKKLFFLKSVFTILILSFISCKSKKVHLIQSNIVCSACILKVDELCDSLNIKSYKIYVHVRNMPYYKRVQLKKRIQNDSKLNVKIKFINGKKVDTTQFNRYRQAYVLVKDKQQCPLFEIDQIDSIITAK